MRSRLNEVEAIAEYIRLNGVTKCPAACVVRTQAEIRGTDLVALRSYTAAREQRRLEKAFNIYIYKRSLMLLNGAR